MSPLTVAILKRPVRALKRLIPFLRPYRGTTAAGLACVLLSSALGSVNPWLLQHAIDAMVPGRSMRTAWQMAGAMVGVSLVAGAFRFGMRELLNAQSRRVEYDLRNALFRHLLTLDAEYFGRTRTGELMARLTNDLSAVRMAAGPAIMYLVSTAVGGVFALGFMLAIEPRLTALALLPMLPLPWVMVRLGRLIHDRFEEVQEHFGAMTTRVQENLAGTRIVRAYRQEAAESARWASMSDDYLHRNLRLARLQALMNPTFALLGGAGSAVVLGVGGALVVRGTISVGNFVAFGLYLTMLVWPLIAMGWVLNLFQRAGASMQRLVEVLDARARVTDPPVPRALPPAVAGRTLVFRDVGFRYPARAGEDQAPWVFRHLSFTVPAGTTLGIVGGTGSGKSALLDLLARAWDPTEGEILLDGVPLTALPIADLRRELGVVPQETVLFSDTIRANLTYGTRDDADPTWAADVAQLSATIAEFPGGVDTVLGERGINLSGGQKQRAAIARALARRPSVVILDDALSAVDTQTEAAILHGLREALEGRTAIVASHRATAMREADHIIVLDGGRIVEEGDHRSLIERRGRYWELLARQEEESQLALSD